MTSVKLLILIFIVSIQITRQDKTFLLVRPSQFGKSSFINHNLKCFDSVAIGNESKESVTREIKAYKCRENFLFQDELVTLIDTPGYFDSHIDITDEMIMDQLKQEILQILNPKSQTQIDGVLLFDSARDSATKNKHMMLRLEQIFTKEISKSIVLLLNKANSILSDELEGIIKPKKEFCSENQIQGPVKYDTKWKHKKYNDSEIHENNKNLIATLENLQPFTSKEFQEIQQKVQNKMDELKNIKFAYVNTTETKFGKNQEQCQMVLEKISKQVTSLCPRPESFLLIFRWTEYYDCPKVETSYQQRQECVSFQDREIVTLSKIQLKTEEDKNLIKGFKTIKNVKRENDKNCKPFKTWINDNQQSTDICGKFEIKYVNLVEQIELYEDEYYEKKAKDILNKEINLKKYNQINCNEQNNQC